MKRQKQDESKFGDTTEFGMSGKSAFCENDMNSEIARLHSNVNVRISTKVQFF